MRYPREDGQFKADQQQNRSQWFQDNLHMSKEEAEDLAFQEMERLFTMEPNALSDNDPLNSLDIIAARAGNQYGAAEAEYWNYYHRLEKNLITIIPMKTYQKTRYYVGMDLSIYPNGMLPPPKTLFAINANRFANVAKRMAASGTFSTEQEHKIHKMESMDMIRSADRFGINPDRHEFANDFNIPRQLKHPERCRRAYKDIFADRTSVQMSESDASVLTRATEKSLSNYSSTIPDWSESHNTPNTSQLEKIEEEARSSNDGVDQSTDNNETKSTVQREVAKRVALKKNVRPNIVQDVQINQLVADVPKVSIRQNLQKKKDEREWEFDITITSSVIDSEATVLDNAKDFEEPTEYCPTVVRPRPKAATLGSYFESIAAIFAPAYGTVMFPMPPNTEKLHWEVGVGSLQADLEKYDGEFVYQYIDDIKNHMKPIIDAMDFMPNDDWGLDRYSNDIEYNLRK